MEAIPIKIPAQSYLKKYLLHELGPEPIRISNKDRFGAFLRRLLQRNAAIRHSYHDPQEAVIEFQLPWDYLTRNGCQVTREAVHRFKQFVREDFYRSLKNYLDAATLYNSDLLIRQAIEDFMDRYELNEDDISYEALKKHYYRARKKEMAL
jgi:hypothetical protein